MVGPVIVLPRAFIVPMPAQGRPEGASCRAYADPARSTLRTETRPCTQKGNSQFAADVIQAFKPWELEHERTI